MSSYNTILLAIDLTEEADEVAAKAVNLSGQQNASLHVIHVIEPLSFAYGGDIPMDFSSIQEEIQKQAETQLTEFADKHNIPAERISAS